MQMLIISPINKHNAAILFIQPELNNIYTPSLMDILEWTDRCFVKPGSDTL